MVPPGGSDYITRNNPRSKQKALSKTEQEIADYKQMHVEGLIDADTLSGLITGLAENGVATPDIEWDDGKLYPIGTNPDGSARFVRAAGRVTGPVDNRTTEKGVSLGRMGKTKTGLQFFPKAWIRTSEVPRLAEIAKAIEAEE